MPSLICLVQRLSLVGGQLIKENEQFEVDAVTAEIYIKGGIANLAPLPVYAEAQELKASEEGQPEAQIEATTRKKRQR